MVLANLSQSRFVRGALIMVASSAVATLGPYIAFGTSDRLLTLLRLVAMLLVCVVAWQGRSWARWVLAFFGIGSLLGALRLVNELSALSTFGYVMLIAHAALVIGVVILLTPKARPYFSQSQVGSG
jgi:hypothetical protein